jgi:DNA-binding CsgD family transcriptional regulator
MPHGFRLESIYEALLDDGAFASLPDRLTELCDARSAIMLWRHTDGFTETLSHNYFPPAFMETYRAKWAKDDPWINASLAAAGADDSVLLARHVPAEVYQRTPFYNDFIRKEGDDTFHCAGTAFNSRYGYGILGIHRGRHAEPFDEESEKRIGHVKACIGHVLQARSEIAAARRTADDAKAVLDTIGLVAVMVGSEGRILYGNAAAEALFRRQDGIEANAGHLRIPDARASRKLAGAIANATASENPAASAIAVPRADGAPPYLVTVTPLPGRDGLSAALVLFRDPAMTDLAHRFYLRELFALSPAETWVALELANGRNLAQIAQMRGVRQSTLRSQLKSIAAKTGCSRQPELVALIRSLPATFPGAS